MVYPLGDIPPLTKIQAIEARDIIISNMREQSINFERG
jgi:hypothetical protein